MYDEREDTYVFLVLMKNRKFSRFLGYFIPGILVKHMHLFFSIRKREQKRGRFPELVKKNLTDA